MVTSWQELGLKEKNVLLKYIMGNKTMIRGTISTRVLIKTPACEFHLFLQGGIGGAKLGGGPGVNKDEKRS